MPKDKKPSVAELTKQLLAALNQDDEHWMHEAQDRQAESADTAENILIAAGYTANDELWDDLVDELSLEVVWMPGHYELARRANAAALKKGR